MFRSKRHSLVKRLWKHRLINDETQSATETPEELELKSVAHTMLKRLKEKQLDILVQSVESKGGENTECVLLPKEHVRVGRRSFSHHNLCCRLWRWPDLSQEAELKRLSCCNTVNDPGYVCCNPYHWSLLLKPGMMSVLTAPSATSAQRGHICFYLCYEWLNARFRPKVYHNITL